MNVKLGGTGGVSPVVHFHTTLPCLLRRLLLCCYVPQDIRRVFLISNLTLFYCFVPFRLGLHNIAFEIMQSELLTEGEKSTGLMSLRQTEYFTGEEKHLKFLEGYPDVSPCSSKLLRQ